MKTTILSLAFSLLCLSSFAQYNKTNLKLPAESELSKYAYKNLQLYPIKAGSAFKSAHKSFGKYLNLEKALAQKKIVISEKGGSSADGAEVNELYVENNSSD